MSVVLYNSLARKKEALEPLTAGKVRMYVCGPTVYDRPHIGNARSVVVYDVLYRLLRHVYGENNVIYARNITDVDDKINEAAKKNGEPISALTARVTEWFHSDMDALGCLRPTHEPRATEYLRGDKEIQKMIAQLIANGHAYEAQGHVLFDVTKPSSNEHWHYGMLSGRTVEEQQAGARIAVESYKKHPGDFVLWKPAEAGDDPSSVFESPWGPGRPGWHIECSAMSTNLLGNDFDIHGGGADLKFPHHENEIAQSCCANPGSSFAKLWVHNGFLTVNGEKMSKSLGNFITVRDLLGRGVKGEVIRLALLSAKYNEPLNWTDKLVEDAKSTLDRLYAACGLMWGLPSNEIHEDYPLWLERYQAFLRSGEWNDEWTSNRAVELESVFFEALKNDLNTAEAIATLVEMTRAKTKGTRGDNPVKQPEDPSYFFSSRVVLKKCCDVLGLLQHTHEEWFRGDGDDSAIVQQVEARAAAKKAKNWAEADRIRAELKAQGILLEDRPDGTTEWRRA